MSDHHHDHHGDINQQNEKKLWIVLALVSTVLIAEIIGSFLTSSLALLSDAMHMFTDAMALAIALVALRLARRPADKKRTYGYSRFEVLSAVFNSLLLLVVSGFILFEAFNRIKEPATVEIGGMLGFAIVGLLVNVISMKLLMSGQKDSINVRGAYLEVMADLVSSLGVLFAAIVIYLTDWVWVDSLVGVAIGLWILPRTWTLLKESIHILLEGVPDDINLEEIEQKLSRLDGVQSIHDLHVWSLSNKKVTLTVHLVVPMQNKQQILEEAMTMLANDFEIHHVVIQCEEYPCSMTRDELLHYNKG